MHGISGMNGFGSGGGAGFGRKEPPVVRDISLTLEELFTGVIKKFNINRRIRDGPTGGYLQVSKTIECPIKPGYKAGTKLTFPDDGDEQPDGSFQDIQFVIQEKPHSLFTRQGNDLCHKTNVSLKDALVGFEFTIRGIDGVVERISMRGVVQPGYKHTMKGKGMPISKQSGARGDLVIEFSVIFPAFLNEQQKGMITAAL